MISRFSKLQITGEVMAWNEAFIEGPLDNAIGKPAFWKNRIAYWKQQSDHLPKPFYSLLKGNLGRYEHIYCWFEYDLFCQMNLLGAVNYLIQCNYQNAISLVQIGPEELGCYGTYGTAPLADWHACFGLSKLLNGNDLAYLSLIWDHISSYEIELVNRAIGMKPYEKFNYLAQALNLVNGLFPNFETGLNEIESSFLNLKIARPNLTINELLGRLLDGMHLYGFGDSQISKMLEDVKLLNGEANEINHISKEILATRKLRTKSFSNFSLNLFEYDSKAKLIIKRNNNILN